MTPRAEAGVHLVGSVPLVDAETVFRTVAATVGPYLRRIPDGETGERRRWIWFQRTMLENHPDMELDPTVPLFALRQWDGKVLRETPLLRLRPGLDPEAVVFETGYAAAAKSGQDVHVGTTKVISGGAICREQGAGTRCDSFKAITCMK